MSCLQCPAPATVTEKYNGVEIRTCEVGHRTGRATRAMIKASKKIRLKARAIAKSTVRDSEYVFNLEMREAVGQ